MNQRYCDIVMKGGITSGVVYPLAVYELSKTYRFRNVGGTSVGALAAAAAAAAEYGRDRVGGGFEELKKLPGWLAAMSPDGRQTNLAALFQPQPATRPLFALLTAAIGPGRGRIPRIAGAIIRSFPLAVLAGALPGALLAYLSVTSVAGSIRWAALASSLLLVLLGAALAAGWAIWRRATRRLPENYFGLCTGHADQHASSVPPLTDWLADYVDKLAGKKAADGPLTFGDLKGSGEQADINLLMLTTSLTHGRPYRVPFEENTFFFDPDQWRKLFPERVVRWMLDHPRAPAEPGDRLRPLPAAKDLPVVVGARLSLSFPGLLSALPLYAVDYSRTRPQERKPEICWFSDGGICSNFPVHFFDQPLPRWPTFAINLRPFHPDKPEVEVWMPESNSGGIAEWWTRFDAASGPDRTLGFVVAIFGAMQNWVDNTQLRLPGYRDRVAHVSVGADEGGLNLNMPAEVVRRLSRRGSRAGEELVRRFAPTANAPELDWDNHRWIRYRSTMSLVEEMLRRIGRSLGSVAPGDRSYYQLILRGQAETPKGYQWKNDDHRDFAVTATEKLAVLAGDLGAAKTPFACGAPRPMPMLRIMPRI